MEDQETDGTVAPVNVWETLSQAVKNKATEVLIQIAEELIVANHNQTSPPISDISSKVKEDVRDNRN